MERKLSINIVEFDGENAIEIFYNGYNIVQETIYDNELATEILTLIRETRQTDGNATL